MKHIYSAVFSAVAVSAAQDVFEIVAPSKARVTIKRIILGQYTDFGDAAAEILSVKIIKGYTTSGSGGSAVTPQSLNGWAPPSSATVEGNNTTVATGGTAVDLHADAINIANGWAYNPGEGEEITIQDGERLVVRLTVPADAITMNGTLIFEETEPTKA